MPRFLVELGPRLPLWLLWLVNRIVLCVMMMMVSLLSLSLGCKHLPLPARVPTPIEDVVGADLKWLHRRVVFNGLVGDDDNVVF